MPGAETQDNQAGAVRCQSCEGTEFSIRTIGVWTCRIVTWGRSKQLKDTLVASGVAKFYFKDGHTEFEITYVRTKDH